MLLPIFKKDYIVRRHGEQTVIDGHPAKKADKIFRAMLNVQPASTDELAVLPEGERTVSRLKVFSTFPFVTASQETGIPGDWLNYHGYWYECKSANIWDHTLLSHYESEFVIIPNQKAGESL